MTGPEEFELNDESDEDLDIGADESEGVAGGATMIRTKFGPTQGTSDCCFCSPRSA